MRAALVAFALMLSACALSPAQHALIAVAASDAVEQVGTAMQQEMRDDYASAGGEAATPDAVAALDAHWSPLLAYYQAAAKALDVYAAAIRAADKAGDKSLLVDPAEQMLGAWAQLGAVTDAIGVELPAPPKALVTFAGGGK